RGPHLQHAEICRGAAETQPDVMEISGGETWIAIAHHVRQSAVDQLPRQGHIDAELKFGASGVDVESPPVFGDQTESSDPFANRRRLSTGALPISFHTCHPLAHAQYLSASA